MTIVERYRRTAMRLYGLTREQAEQAIVAPEDDTGEWAPRSEAVIYLEYGYIPCNYWETRGHEECLTFGNAVGVGYIEYVNAAVAAVYT